MAYLGNWTNEQYFVSVKLWTKRSQNMEQQKEDYIVARQIDQTNEIKCYLLAEDILLQNTPLIRMN